MKNNKIFWINIFLLLFCLEVVSALTCTVTNTTSCTGTFVLYIKNDSGGWSNAHAQNTSVATYPYGICCSASEQTVGTTCSSTAPTFLKLSATTNAHVEVFNLSNYANNACLSVTNRNVTCTYSSGACSAGYSCVASIASSESSANNLTNAHIDGNCTSTYPTKICCGYSNRVPIISSVILNSTSVNNYTTDNLTVYYSASDSDLDALYNFTDFRKEGTSIAVLNMPFNINTSSTTSGAITDYSTYARNGTLNNSVSWTPNGKIGGAYYFNRSTNISATHIQPAGTYNMINKTITAWVKRDSIGHWSGIASRCSGNWYFAIRNTNALVLSWGNSSGNQVTCAGLSVSNTNWNFVGVRTRVEGNNVNITLYLNNQTYSCANTQGITSSAVTTYIGSMNSDCSQSGGTVFNGTIDEFKFYTIPLSDEQIYQEYLAGLNNRSTNVLVETETQVGENWSTLVGVCDTQSCTTGTSNTVTIRTRIPNQVQLISPTNNNYTIHDKQPVFIWNSTSLATYYEINITSNNCAAIFSNNTNIGSVTSNFTPSQELCLQTEGGSNTFYNWTVRGCSADSCGNWSTIFNFSIEPFLSITLTNNNVSFGSLNPSQNANTTNLSITPFTFRNDGNVYANMTNATINQTFWYGTNAGLGTSYFQLTSGETTETNSFNTTHSVTTWINASSNNPGLIKRLNYQDTTDSGYVHTKITVPGDEPPGDKFTYITFVWEQN